MNGWDGIMLPPSLLNKICEMLCIDNDHNHREQGYSVFLLVFVNLKAQKIWTIRLEFQSQSKEQMHVHVNKLEGSFRYKGPITTGDPPLVYQFTLH